MKINLNLGAIYDTIRFFEIHFNYDEIIHDLEIRNYDVEEELKYYNQLIKNIEVLPQLHAFFDFNRNEKSLLTSIFIHYIKDMSTINDYILLLKDTTLNNLIDYYFTEITLQEKEEIRKNHSGNTALQQIYNLEINSKMKLSLGLIFADYYNYLNLLINSICDVYNKIMLLHKTKNKFISGFIIKENYLNKLIEVVKAESFDDAIYFFSLLQPYSVKIINGKFLILGTLFEEVLDKQYTFINASLDSICNAFGSKLNMLIIDIMHKHKKIHAAEIIKLLPAEYSIPTVYRIIANLHREKVIVITENKNKKIYYSLNLGYFENAVVVFNKFIMYYLDKN